MQKRFLNWQVVLGVILLSLATLVYFIHYLIFRDLHHIFLYLIGDIAFVFIEVLLVTLIIHRLLTYREKQNLLNKLNMLIGAFYSEVGMPLIKILSTFDPEFFKTANKLVVTNQWTDKDFVSLAEYFNDLECNVDSKQGKLKELKDILIEKRGFLLNLLANPNLLEHESFTSLLWAVFHLTEELTFRPSFDNLPDKDYSHLSGDIKRAYKVIIYEWLSYMRHLKKEYPYLFSLALRTNPFDPNAQVIIHN